MSKSMVNCRIGIRPYNNTNVSQCSVSVSHSHCTVRVNVTVPGFLRLFSSVDEKYFSSIDPFTLIVQRGGCIHDVAKLCLNIEMPGKSEDTLYRSCE